MEGVGSEKGLRTRQSSALDQAGNEMTCYGAEPAWKCSISLKYCSTFYRNTQRLSGTLTVSFLI